DPLIGAQVAEQIRAADRLLATRTDIAPLAALREAIAPLSSAPLVEAPHGRAPVDLLLDRPAGTAPGESGAHGHDHGAAYASWSVSDGAVKEAGLRALLSDPPAGLYRFKGLVRVEAGAVEAQLVGRSWSVTPAAAARTRAVAIGPAPLFEPAAFQAAWAAIAA
ncbi:MAG: GTP-binding protein, partial [Paracoccaceae bacterium]